MHTTCINLYSLYMFVLHNRLGLDQYYYMVIHVIYFTVGRTYTVQEDTYICNMSLYSIVNSSCSRYSSKVGSDCMFNLS